MLKGQKMYMSFDTEISLYVLLSRIKSILLRDKSRFQYTFFNFPRAWLLLGVFEYGKVKKNSAAIELVKEKCEDYLDKSGELRFSFDKLDQVLFGLVFIKMHQEFGDEKYKKGAQNIYKALAAFRTEEGIYLYRGDLKVLFVDTIGMVIPFLYEYGTEFSIPEVLGDARMQLQYFHAVMGMDKRSKFPHHAFDMEKSMMLGSANWSRGTAWYSVGVSYALQYESELDWLQEHYALMMQDLKLLSINSYWPQFLGHTDETSIDASATVMFWYSLALRGEDVYDDLARALEHAINPQGFVEFSSGDTFYINKYSRLKSKSELTQGILLLLLAQRAKCRTSSEAREMRVS